MGLLRITRTNGVAIGVIVFLIGGFVWPGMDWIFGKEFHQPQRYVRPIPASPPERMRSWQFIVIHHTGAMVGNESMIETGHLERGMENGMAYHFLIGNGSAGLPDGQIVAGHRWIYQLQGGHSHQEDLNENGIGICLVGNFNRKEPTAKQMNSLAGLLIHLQGRFNIPDGRIHGHGDYLGEESDCPGRYFSFEKLWTAVDEVYQNMTPDDVIFMANVTHVRLAGDGSILSRKE